MAPSFPVPTLHKATWLVDGVAVFQGYKLELGSGEKEEIKDLKELEPNIGRIEAELRCEQRPHHLPG